MDFSLNLGQLIYNMTTQASASTRELKLELEEFLTSDGYFTLGVYSAVTTVSPTVFSTRSPTVTPTGYPTQAPVVTSAPTRTPTIAPTAGTVVGKVNFNSTLTLALSSTVSDLTSETSTQVKSLVQSTLASGLGLETSQITVTSLAVTSRRRKHRLLTSSALSVGFEVRSFAPGFVGPDSQCPVRGRSLMRHLDADPVKSF